MPNDNQKSAVSSQQPQTGSMPPISTDDMSPLVVEETAPPILNTSDLPVVEERKEETNETNSGSAAPSDDIVMAPVVTTQKKKFAGGKVIATILGLFLLVGGLGAGTYLVQQQQDIREKAGACSDNPCGPGLQCDGSGGCIPKGSGDDYKGPVYEPEGWVGETNTDPDTGVTTCANRCYLEGEYDFCLPAGSTSCNSEAIDRGYAVKIGEGNGNISGNYDGGWICKEGINGYTRGESCVQNNSVPNSSQYSSVPNCFCGTIQIDGGTNDGTYEMKCGCNNENTPPEPTPGSITAQCQNVKAYSSTWTLLTSAQLAQLKTGDSVNFCVTGSATGGSFDKARFTINSVLQAETTTIRPSSTDFCQSYVIPAGVTTFNVSAEINHVTLGWK